MHPYDPSSPFPFLHKLHRSNAVLNAVCSVYHCTYLNLGHDEAIAAGGKSFTAYAYRPSDSVPVWARQFHMKKRIEMRDMTMMNLLHNYVVSELETLAGDPTNAVVRMNGFDRDAWKAAIGAMPSAPDLIIAGENSYRAFANSLDLQFSDKSTANHGFKNCVLVEGGKVVPVVLESAFSSMPTDVAYLVSSRRLIFWTGHLRATEDANRCALNWVGALSVLPTIQ